MISLEELKHMQSINIMDLKKEELANAQDIVIDTEKPLESRIESYIEQTGNPFAQNVGDYILQFKYSQEATDSIEERFLLLEKRKAQVMF